MARPRVLLVDDDLIVMGIVRDLLHICYETVYASTGAQALSQIRNTSPDLVILDLRLPDIDGLILIGMIRCYSTVPIIVLSARHEQADVVIALQAGADDFIHKPFDIDDLEARVEVVLRRCKREPIPPQPEPTAFGTLKLNHSRASVNDTYVPMTPTGYRLLTLLVEAGGEVVLKSEITEALWSATDDDLFRTLRNHVGRLRDALEVIPDAPSIETIRGRGYRLQSK